MLRYIAIRTVWIFIVLVSFLSILFITIKLVPEFPPTEENARSIYYARQVSDGYMTTYIEYDQNVISQILNGTYDRCSGCAYYQVEIFCTFIFQCLLFNNIGHGEEIF